MRPSAHFCAVAAGVICLIALAALLWETEEPDHCATSCWGSWDGDGDPADPVPDRATRVKSYAGGRTMIAPLVSGEYMRRRYN